MAEFLIDPNIAYLLLVGGLVTAVLALLTPGSGLLEIGALFMLVLSGYGLYKLPLQLWSLVIILLGLVAFLLSLRVKKYRWWLLVASLAAFIIGSIFLFKGEDGSPAVHPVLASAVSLMAVGSLWWVGTKIMAVVSLRPVHSLDRLIGMTGFADGEIHFQGTVYVDGEYWTARSEIIVPAGSPVKISGREGLTLLVEVLSEDI